MTVQFFSADGIKIFFQDATSKKYSDPLLPGAIISENASESGKIILQEYAVSLFGIGYRLFETTKKLKIVVNEKPFIRLEAMLSGEVIIMRDNKKIKLRTGEYHLTDVPLFTSLFKPSNSSSSFIIYFSKELLEQLGIALQSCAPLKMTDRMNHLIKEMLHHPYDEHLRSFYYENSVRELLFYHLTQDKQPIPGELENRDIDAVYEADKIIASNLQQHFTIEELCRMTRTNEFKLKKGFRNIFGMGVFQRLLFRRMEQAKVLLEKTNKPIGDIALLTGYDTAAGFIHAFRREFKMTPREWRLSSRDQNDDEDIAV
jgi:AraC-like DNA-binding protein